MKENIPMANISIQTLIRECSLGRRPEDDIFYDFSLTNRENIHEIFKYRKFNYDFSDYLTCYNDGEHIIGYIRPSYDDFLYSVLRFLGVKTKGAVIDDENLTKAMMERVKRLKEIRSEQELQMEFPYLYEDLIQGRSFIRSVERMERLNEEDQNRYEQQRHYYYSCALKQRLDRFLETQAKLYERFTNQREEYKNLISKKSYNAKMKYYFDMDKVAMYIIHTYLVICEQTTDENTLKRYMTLIEKYQNSSYKKDVSLKTDEGILLNWDTIQGRIQNIKRKMNNNEALAEWELVPEGRDYSRVRIEGETKPRETIFNYEEMERLRKAGERKRAFYESTPYLVKVMGLLRYRGYIGYIYPNGEVLLDREYNEDTPRSAKGDAIYNMKAVDFETLSRLDKTVLRKHPKVGRIIHSKHWEEKAKEVIEKDGTEKDQEEAKKLVKRLKEKKERSE